MLQCSTCEVIVELSVVTDGSNYTARQDSAGVVVKSDYSVHPKIAKLLMRYKTVFQETTKLPPKRNCDLVINLVAGAHLLVLGHIVPSQSSFASPALLVKKKNSTWRLCANYRRLNSLPVKNKYPIPMVEFLDELFSAIAFSKVDIRAGYHQVRMQTGKEFKTAF
ncbi:uncharacterized protein LOC132065666 [Lycium ferocissimum]|uniref:uncharacterized protein LOC132065666 n=1 Tax=Lycium ferocissimum TaxID=112874 RepID=UPI002814FF31|nr:uncharacterized protein LOC132065666 [Lycium ferocissimum]